jgi:L-proline amide hydrolase
MPPIPTPTREGVVPFRGHQTWFRVTGGQDASLPPLVVLHGGPGALHDYTLRFAHLASPQRAVVHYDQIGCGRSTHLPKAAPEFWSVELFLAELEVVLAHLGIAGSYHLLGQSWGGMLGAEHAIRQPTGLRGLVIANSPPSMALWVQEANRLRADLPEAVQATLLRHEADGTTDAPEYEAATMAFYARHVCRIQPFPPEVAASFAGIAEDPTVYHTMSGPSEFHCTGSLKTWSVIDRLHRITAPTLLLSGRHDEATPAVVMPFFEGIAGAAWHIFGHSSHMPHVEETEACMAVVGAFLASQD